jgi:hypothetical protein
VFAVTADNRYDGRIPPGNGAQGGGPKAGPDL